MIIIVDGIDRVGKTTLCHMIEDKYREVMFPPMYIFKDDSRYVHNHNNEMVNTEKNNTIMNMLEHGVVQNIILDRFHMTEFVYGGIERSYKNVDMYDIDHRLAELAKPDTLVEDEDWPDLVDPGMSFTGKVWNEVVLIYVVPTDIKASSQEHGYNLERHLKWYNDFYDNTEIKNKIKVDYKTLDEALDFIDEILGLDEKEETEVSEEPTEPSEGEDDIEEGENGDKEPDTGISDGENNNSSIESIIKNSSFFNRAK